MGGVKHLLYQKEIGALNATDHKGLRNQTIGDKKLIIDRL